MHLLENIRLARGVCGVYKKKKRPMQAYLKVSDYRLRITRRHEQAHLDFQEGRLCSHHLVYTHLRKINRKVPKDLGMRKARSRRQKEKMVGKLAPVDEEPSNEEDRFHKKRTCIGRWLKNHWSSSHMKKSDLKILLSVIACPLSPVSVPPANYSSVSSSADYIIRQFRATTGCAKKDRLAKSMYASGTVKLLMANEQQANSTQNSSRQCYAGCFVLWQMPMDMWLMELNVVGQKISAGGDGKVAWRRTPWLGGHAARGSVRPLRRTLQGLDPVTIAEVFALAEHVGEKEICGEDCFVLKLETDQSDLSTRSDSTADVIKHVMVGYFSQRSGLLVYLEDSQLTRIQSPGAQAMYWETTISTSIEDYREVDGVMIAHSGYSTVNLERFGAGLNAPRSSTKMEEAWRIDDVAFNVVGLSADYFILPEDVQKNLSNNCHSWDES